MSETEKPKEDSINLKYQDVVITKNRVFYHGKQRKISQRGFELLVFFMQNPNKILSKAEIKELVWNGQAAGGHSIVHAVGDIRYAFGWQPGEGYLDNIRSKGYIWR